jgi:hypothetical protein
MILGEVSLPVVKDDIASTFAIGYHKIKSIVAIDVCEHNVSRIPRRIPPSARKRKFPTTIVEVNLLFIRGIIAYDNIQVTVGIHIA